MTQPTWTSSRWWRWSWSRRCSRRWWGSQARSSWSIQAPGCSISITLVLSFIIVMLVIITIIMPIAHQWISDLLGADAVESPDHNQVWGEEVPGRFWKLLLWTLWCGLTWHNDRRQSSRGRTRWRGWWRGGRGRRCSKPGWGRAVITRVIGWM